MHRIEALDGRHRVRLDALIKSKEFGIGNFEFALFSYVVRQHLIIDRSSRSCDRMLQGRDGILQVSKLLLRQNNVTGALCDAQRRSLKPSWQSHDHSSYFPDAVMGAASVVPVPGRVPAIRMSLSHLCP